MFLENQRENIANIIKQNLAVGDIFKRENMQVEILAWYLPNLSPVREFIPSLYKCVALMQIMTDELVKEVENSIAEFKQHNQDYDEDSVKAQVTFQILML